MHLRVFLMMAQMLSAQIQGLQDETEGLDRAR
jgi:hypothetical protein